MQRGILAAVLIAGVAAACGGSGGNKDNKSGSGADAAPDACMRGSDACIDPCNAGNSLGVGKFCTKGGGECSNDTAPFEFCTEDYEPSGTGMGFCTGPCGSDADCGDGATCSGSGMGSKGCVPDVCN